MGYVTVDANAPTIGTTLSPYNPNAIFNVVLIQSSNATLGTSTGLGTIIDVVPTITPENATVNEPASGQTATMAFDVFLNETSVATTTVNYNTANIAGGAVAGVDYTAASGTLSFAAGTDLAIIDVTVLHDSVFNSNLVFDLNLSSPSGATIATATAVGTIVDPTPSISVSSPSVNEPGSGNTTQLPFVITLGATSAYPVTVQYATASVAGGLLPEVIINRLQALSHFLPGRLQKPSMSLFTVMKAITLTRFLI